MPLHVCVCFLFVELASGHNVTVLDLFMIVKLTELLMCLCRLCEPLYRADSHDIPEQHQPTEPSLSSSLPAYYNEKSNNNNAELVCSEEARSFSV